MTTPLNALSERNRLTALAALILTVAALAGCVDTTGGTKGIQNQFAPLNITGTLTGPTNTGQLTFTGPHGSIGIGVFDGHFEGSVPAGTTTVCFQPIGDSQVCAPAPVTIDQDTTLTVSMAGPVLTVTPT